MTVPPAERLRALFWLSKTFEAFPLSREEAEALLDAALAAERRATVERIRAKVNYRWSVGGELTRREVRAILDAEADR